MLFLLEINSNFGQIVELVVLQFKNLFTVWTGEGDYIFAKQTFSAETCEYTRV